LGVYCRPNIPSREFAELSLPPRIAGGEAGDVLTFFLMVVVLPILVLSNAVADALFRLIQWDEGEIPSWHFLSDNDPH
jgi:hypothetical protein